MNGQAPPRGNQSSNGHTGGRSCPEGCTCGRHYKAKKPQTRCIVTDRNGRCENVGYTSEGVCKKHNSRMLRTGTYEPRLKKLDLPVKVGSPTYCLCSHKAEDHKIGRSGRSDREECREDGCRCLKFDRTDTIFMRRRLTELKRLGYLKVLNNKVFCSACKQWIQLGHWYDPIVLRRGLIHRRQTCPALRRGRHPA